MSADASAPYDRPNLSKDFLAGNAPDDWIPLRAPEWYGERRIDLMLDTRVNALDVVRRSLDLGNGRTRSYGSLLLATGADPVHLPIPGATDAQVHYLRTLRRQPGTGRQSRDRKARRGRRCELHRPRGRGVAARARHRRARRSAGDGAARAHHGRGCRPLRTGPARGARRRVPSRTHDRTCRRRQRHAERWLDLRRRHHRPWGRRAAFDRARRRRPASRSTAASS